MIVIGVAMWEVLWRHWAERREPKDWKIVVI